MKVNCELIITTGKFFIIFENAIIYEINVLFLLLYPIPVYQSITNFAIVALQNTSADIAPNRFLKLTSHFVFRPSGPPLYPKSCSEQYFVESSITCSSWYG